MGDERDFEEQMRNRCIGAASVGSTIKSMLCSFAYGCGTAGEPRESLIVMKL